MNRLMELIHLNADEKAARGLSHTPDEILQQPQTWLGTFRKFQADRAAIEAFLRTAGIGAETEKRPIVFLIGAGTSDYIGHALAGLLRQKWQCEVAAVASTDLLTNFEDFILPDRRYLWISFSRSGDSPEGVAVLNRALESCKNVLHFVVTCNRDGQMMRAHLDDPRLFRFLLDDAVNDRGLAMTSSFSNMVICGQCLANLWTIDDYEPILRALSQASKQFLETAADAAAKLADGPYTNVCFAGSGALKAIARESALKVSELTAGRIQTMSESTLGLRHGPLAALNQESLFVGFISSDKRRQRYETDLLREIGAKGVIPMRVAVGLEVTSELRRECELFISAGLDIAIGDEYRPPLDVIFGQLLGLFFSIRCGLKPDAPSPNCVISRVVQNVEIH
jgi:tagatose-6-phosphate ketose/aldose isomerase